MKKALMRIVDRMSRRQLALGEVLIAVRERETRELRWDEPRPASSIASLLGVLATVAALGGGLAAADARSKSGGEGDVAWICCEPVPEEPVAGLVEGGPDHRIAARPA